jgi:hypothetical protein
VQLSGVFPDSKVGEASITLTSDIC